MALCSFARSFPVFKSGLCWTFWFMERIHPSLWGVCSKLAMAYLNLVGKRLCGPIPMWRDLTLTMGTMRMLTFIVHNWPHYILRVIWKHFLPFCLQCSCFLTEQGSWRFIKIITKSKTHNRISFFCLFGLSANFFPLASYKVLEQFTNKSDLTISKSYRSLYLRLLVCQ